MLVTADQLVCHAVGDYLLQSDWAANNKTKHWYAALYHAYCYSVSFMLIVHSKVALLLILVTHYFIDRYRLARYVVFAKNILFGSYAKKYLQWNDYQTELEGETHFSEGCSRTGYPADTPIWMAVWLLVIADNILHVLINALAIKYF